MYTTRRSKSVHRRSAPEKSLYYASIPLRSFAADSNAKTLRMMSAWCDNASWHSGQRPSIRNSFPASNRKRKNKQKNKDNGKTRTCAPKGIWIATRRVNHSATLSCFNVEVWLIMSNIVRKVEMNHFLATRWVALRHRVSYK